MVNQENGVDLKSATQSDERKLFIETYGCQMNVADSEVVASIMKMDGYSMTENIEEAYVLTGSQSPFFCKIRMATRRLNHV